VTAPAPVGPTPPPAPTPTRRTSHAALVAAGILLSRVIGLVRQRIFSRYFGLSVAGDAFTAAFRIPNFLQNLFGEGVLSASFIPEYASLLARGDEEAADRLASAIFTLLAIAVTVVVALGIVATPVIVDTIVGGFEGEKRLLTIRLVRILFPGAGLLALSAWCLGILNSHRRFFLSYAAPVLWSAAMIATLLWYGPRHDAASLDRLAVVLAWGSVAGSLLQLLVQMPGVLSLVRHLRPRLDLRNPSVRAVTRGFAPVFVSRGVVQLSAFIDQYLASFLGDGAVTALNNAQTIYLLPISLFGMAVSVAALPEMARAQATEGDALGTYLHGELERGMRRIAFYVVPSAAAFLALGDVLVGALFQTGRFGRADTLYVWTILAGSAVGLLAAALGRLVSSTYYALRDTRTPLRFAIVRVALTLAGGWAFAFPLRQALGLDARWGAAGLTASMGLAGWVELALLRRGLRQRIGQPSLGAGHLARLWGPAIAAAAAGFGTKLLVGPRPPLLVAALVVPVFGLVYFGGTALLGVGEASAVFARVRRLARRG
jgi:putative peptidoglycan lipid II flippase